ncbi:unnamed protein product [Ostreobium quekettii]|uniref:Uncharacterized protein n=1 Tax=Ostreobium quekettii TaxID=121088 RepID=A0A8S1J9K0_9CHLO|nr:unnamed protein product [Ostreobium quekettii]
MDGAPQDGDRMDEDCSSGDGSSAAPRGTLTPGVLVKIESPVQATDWLRSKGKKMKDITTYLTEKRLISAGKKRDCRVEYGPSGREFKKLRPKINLYALAVAALANIGNLGEDQTITCFVRWLVSGLGGLTARELMGELEVWVRSLVQRLGVSELHTAVGFGLVEGMNLPAEANLHGQQHHTPPTHLPLDTTDQEDEHDLTDNTAQPFGQLASNEQFPDDYVPSDAQPLAVLEQRSQVDMPMSQYDMSYRQLPNKHGQPTAQSASVTQRWDQLAGHNRQLPGHHLHSAAIPVAQAPERPTLKRRRSYMESQARTVAPQLAVWQVFVCLLFFPS